MAVAETQYFNPARVDAEVWQAHFCYGSRSEKDCYLADPQKVGKYAGAMARRYYGLRQRGTTATGRVLFVEYAGKCVYALDHYGWNWLDLCRVATPAVANIVAQVSADTRLELNKMKVCQMVRLMKRADDEGQIVRMAEIIASANRLADDIEFPEVQTIAERDVILQWIRHQDAQLSCLKGRLFADTRFATVVLQADRLIGRVYGKIRRPRERPAVAAGRMMVGVGESRVAIPTSIIPQGWYDGAGPQPEDDEDDDAILQRGRVGAGLAALVG